MSLTHALDSRGYDSSLPHTKLKLYYNIYQFIV